MCGIQIKMGETLTTPSPRPHEGNAEPPNHPEGGPASRDAVRGAERTTLLALPSPASPDGPLPGAVSAGSEGPHLPPECSGPPSCSQLCYGANATTC